MQKELLRTDELLPLLGVSRSTLYEWARRGEIPKPFNGRWHLPSVRAAIQTAIGAAPQFDLPDPEGEPEERKSPGKSGRVRRQAPLIVPHRPKK